MMMMNNIFFNNENVARIGFGIGVAVFFHLGILAWASQNQLQKTISSDLFGSPTNITISFSPAEKTPSKAQNKTSKAESKPNTKKIPSKEIVEYAQVEKASKTLNKIEPAATSQETIKISNHSQPHPIQTKPTPQLIPVISEKNLKGRRIQPNYPKRALRMHQEGTVWLHVLISETGARQNIKVHQASQYALLNQAAIKAVKKWTFAPNVINGKATKSWVEIPIEFKIQ